MSFTEKTLFARCLETFTWEDLISLLGFERAKKTVHTRSKDYKSIISLILRSFQEGTDYSDGTDIIALVEERRKCLP